MTHVHLKFRVNKHSTFGLHSIHAILECRGEVDGKPCKYSEIKMLTYADCDAKKSKSGYPTYYYPKGTGDIQDGISRKKTRSR